MSGMTEHDAGYRALFSDKQIVADLIRGFVNEPWVEELDLEMLERVSGSFVSEQFARRENDVIWRVRFRKDWLYVYLLIEFQSTVDRFMALRLMVYVGLLYQRLIDEEQISRSEFLPPVLPLVLYNGTDRWWAPRDVADLVAECPEDLAKYRPRMQYFLLEEHAQDDAELAALENLAALIFRFEKCRTRGDFERVIDALIAWASAPEQRDSIKRLAQWVAMILTPGRVPGELVADLDDIRECGTMLKERVKVWEQELRKEGMQEGIKEGTEKGIEKGIEKGEAELLGLQLEHKFGVLSEEIQRRIDQADREQLRAWAKKVLTAERI